MSEDEGEVIKRKIKIAVDGSEIEKQIDEKLEQKEREKNALRAFERFKSMAMSLFPNDAKEIESCGSVSELDDLVELLEKEKAEGVTKRTPSGKAVIRGTKTDQGWTEENSREKLDKLYFDAYYNTEVSDEDKIDARAKIQQILKALDKSPAMKRLAQGLTHQLWQQNFMNCPKCKRTIDLNTELYPPCPFCGYEPQKPPKDSVVY